MNQVNSYLNKIQAADYAEFSRALPNENPTYLGDTLMPNVKTQNFKVEYMRLSANAHTPVMAYVHAWDSETLIGTRKDFEVLEAETLLIKLKLNQTETLRKYLDAMGGNRAEREVFRYIYDDARNLASAVKARTELMKIEAMTTGKVKIKENGINMTVSYGQPAGNNQSYDWSDGTANVIADLEAMVDLSKASSGLKPNVAIMSERVWRRIRKDEAIQNAINGAGNAGRYVSEGQVKAYIAEAFGLTIYVPEGNVGYQTATGKIAYKPWLDTDTISIFYADGGKAGTGLYGPTPDEQALGLPDVENRQFYTFHKWQTDDPIVTWLRASTVFIPVFPNALSLVVGTITLE